MIALLTFVAGGWVTLCLVALLAWAILRAAVDLLS